MPLDFAAGATAYKLINLPEGTTGLSAKTAWSLRTRLPVSLNANGQAVLDFDGDTVLRAGDLDGSNSINVLDYAILKVNWFTANPAADVNGDGVVNTLDYALMKANWFAVGDP